MNATTENFVKDIIKRYRRDPEKEKALMDSLRQSYIPRPCDICGKLMTFEESINLPLFCSVNPTNRFCCETVSCCDLHTSEERLAFILRKREAIHA